MLVHKTAAEYGKYSLFTIKTGNIFCCLVQKHDPKTVYWFLQRRSVMVLGFVKGYIKYTCNYFIMFKKKSLAKLCLWAPNDIFNVLPPNICQCLQWNEMGSYKRHWRRWCKLCRKNGDRYGTRHFETFWRRLGRWWTGGRTFLTE